MREKVLLGFLGAASIWVPFLFGATQTIEAAPTLARPTVLQEGKVEKEAPMAVDAHPGFLVATIKPSDPNATSSGFPTEGHHITCYNVMLIDILSVAYGIHRKQIVDAPSWSTHDRFDIVGVPDVPGVPSLMQMREMYQKLLAERFHLHIHKDTHELPIYAITVEKSGPRLKLADPSEAVNTGNRRSGGQRTLAFRNMSMADFALNMNFYEDRPVIDETSLPGRYDFTLSWTYDDSQPRENDAAPSLFTAIKEQLGLKMDAVKGPAPVLVIDAVEKPTPN